jgi:hypothetical protein
VATPSFDAFVRPLPALRAAEGARHVSPARARIEAKLGLSEERTYRTFCIDGELSEEGD